ncbi:prepilin peptidase [Streptomyces sp. NPDC093094]|uniref:prepilin peptidase n=1 Tax=Streptomyces sp. NPDC093094 TaxID=3366026 RepID=UPI00381E1949
MAEPALAVLAALWGAAAGALLPRAIHRFAVPAGEPWRDRCPGGHPLRGWLGPARCPECASGAPPADAPAVSPTDVSGVSPADASAVSPADVSAVSPADISGAPADALSDAPAVSPADTSAASPAGSPADVSTGSPADAPGAPTAVPPGAGRAVPAVSGASYGPKVLGPAAVTAPVCAALAAATGARPELVVWLLLAPVCVLLAAVDLRVQRLPDPLTLPLAAAALALLGLAALLPGHAGEWTTSLLGAAALGAGYLVLFLVNPGGMGFGDVKLALGAGAALGWYGWGTLLLGTFAGFLLGALYGGALVVARRADRRTAIPFGPFLIAGALLGVLAGAYTA